MPAAGDLLRQCIWVWLGFSGFFFNRTSILHLYNVA